MKDTYEYRIYNKEHTPTSLRYEIHYCHLYNGKIINHISIGNGIFLKDYDIEGLQQQINQIQEAFDKEVLDG
jgi:hypothetical protein